MDFDALAELEPRLRDLERDVRAFARTHGRSSARAEAAWYGPGGFKARLVKLVGFDREPPGYVAPERLSPSRVDGGGGLVIVSAADPALLENFTRRMRARREAVSQLTPAELGDEKFLVTSNAYDAVYSHLSRLIPAL
jgi:hypothetical protein